MKIFWWYSRFITLKQHSFTLTKSKTIGSKITKNHLFSWSRFAEKYTCLKRQCLSMTNYFTEFAISFDSMWTKNITTLNDCRVSFVCTSGMLSIARQCRISAHNHAHACRIRIARTYMRTLFVDLEGKPQTLSAAHETARKA